MDPVHLETLCSTFDIGAPSEVRENHEGVLNRNFFLTTDRGRYFIKSLREKRKGDVSYIAVAETLMRSRGIPAICMLPTVSGSTYLEMDSFVYTVYPFIESDRSHQYSPDDFKSMGRMLASIHRAGSVDIPAGLREKRLNTKAENSVEQIASYKTILASKDILTDVDRVFLSYIGLKQRMAASLPAAMNPPPSDTFIHGDYHARNLLIDDHRTIIGICDWEQARMAPRAYEIARSIQYLCFAGGSTEHSEIYDVSRAVDSARSFIAGYQELYPIPDDEMRTGFELRFRKIIDSVWIEETYFSLNDPRPLIFIPHEMRLIREFGEEAMFEKLI